MQPISMTPAQVGMSDVRDLASFETFYADYRRMAVEIFEKDKYHTHLISMIGPDGRVAILHFDSILSDVMRQVGKEDKHLPEGKDIVFGIMAKIAKDLDAVGYIEVSEAWTLVYDLGGRDETLEAHAARIGMITADAGGTIKNVPGRAEALCVRGVYGDEVRSHMWQIRRNGKKTVWLVNGREDNHKLDLKASEVYRAGDLDLVIYENAKRAGELKDK